MSRRPEAHLERKVLLALGREPDVLLAKNEVGQGFYGALGPQLCEDCRRVAMRSRLTYGIGVGSPDLIAVVAGRFLGLELKSDDGRVTEEQHMWHAAATQRGARVVVVRSVDEARAAVADLRSSR